MTTRTREADLLLLLARGRLDDRRRAAVVDLLELELDWNLLLELAARHGLAPLFERHLGALGSRGVPRRVTAHLWARAQATQRRNAAMTQELIAIVDALEAKQLQVVPYKGPALACRAYGDLAMREFGDLDLLVRSRDVGAVKQIIAGRGYRPTNALTQAQETRLVSSAVHYELPLVDSARGFMVELHWRGDPDVDLPALDDPSWWNRLPRTVVAGRSMRSLAPTEMVLLLCLHGSKHFWLSLGWLVDIAELIRGEAGIDWDELSTMARRHACERRLVLGLHLARGLLDAPIPQSFLRPPDRAVVRAVEEIERRIFASEAPGFGVLEALWMNLRLQDGPAHAAAYAWKVAVTPGWGEWLSWRLPRPLFFLYWVLRPVRLFAKYVLRLRPRESRLPPGLVHHDGDGVRHVEAAVPGTHR